MLYLGGLTCMDLQSLQVAQESFWRIFSAGVTKTIPLTVISFIGAMILAVSCALVQYANVWGLKQFVRFYIWIFRGTPLLVQLCTLYFGFPNLGIVIDAWTSAVIVFALNCGAYCAETMRSALESVPLGQLEAGYCVGMSWFQIMYRIVLPQAFRTAFPPLFNTLISLVKDTSLASSITVPEMMTQGMRVTGRTYEFMAIYLEVGLIYLLFSTVLTKLQTWGEKKLKTYENK